MQKEKFGTGQDTCKVCGQKISDVKVLRIKVSHQIGAELLNLRYFAPLCPQHRGDGSLDMDIGWEAGTVPIDEMKG